MIEDMIDSLLDRSVLLGYTKIGYQIRRRFWAHAPLRSLQGKKVLITGASSGLGEAAAQSFAQLGAAVTLLVRDEHRGEQVLARIAHSCPGADLQLYTCDLSDLSMIRPVAERITKDLGSLDVLLHNASVLVGTRQQSKQGIELTFATNVIGPFLLTQLLTPLLRGSAPARIITVSSGGMYTQRLSFAQLQSEAGPYHGARAYAQSKRAQVVLAEMWAEQLASTGVVVHSMHPGWVDTPGLRASLPRFHQAMRPLLRNAAEGADTIVWLGSAPEPANSSGEFWHDRKVRATHVLPWTRETDQERTRLWRECERLAATDLTRSGDTPP